MWSVFPERLSTPWQARDWGSVGRWRRDNITGVPQQINVEHVLQKEKETKTLMDDFIIFCYCDIHTHIKCFLICYEKLFLKLQSGHS